MQNRNITGIFLDHGLLRIYSNLELWYAIDCELHINGYSLGKLLHKGTNG